MKLRVFATLFAAALMLIGLPASAGVTGLASSTALPTAQITGIVRASVVVGDTVYATGRFAKARPSGVAAGGSGEVTRGNLVAFSISTGRLTAFSHSLNAEGKAIEISKDGTKLFVGGLFTTVDGQPRAHLAAFTISSGALLPTYNTGPTGAVYAIATAPNGKLYVGGAFSKVGATPRTNLAAYTTTGTLDTGFQSKANAQVAALVVTPDGSKVVAGGSFGAIAGPQSPGGWPAYGLAAFYTSNGEPDMAWASTRPDFPIRNDDPATMKRGVTSLTTDGQQIYGTSFNNLNYGTPGAWEGTFAISPADGHLIWGDNCHGDTYDAFATRGVLYSVSHAHDCAPMGVWPETVPTTSHRANAQTTTVDGVNICLPSGYACYAGMPRSSMLTAYAPTFTVGNYSGASQAAWTVTGNNSFVVLGGEFTKVNGQNQQGLTRMAIS